MKRSQINALIDRADAFMKEYRFTLPPFAYWSPAQWVEKGHECDEIRDNCLGWDITDFGSGDFAKTGLTLFCLRNGNQKQPDKYPKPYAEKLMISEEEQVCPLHFHWHKREDIINRGGGVLIMQLFASDADEQLLPDAPVTVVSDGVALTLPGGSCLELQPGQSLTLTPGLYHSFWGKKGCGTVLVGEVSQCNDDASDNRFWNPVGRFPAVEEDVPATHLLCTEYPAAK